MKKSTNKALNALTKDLAKEQLDLAQTSGDLMEVICIVSESEDDLHDCVNELCLKCGQYRQEHLGACDGCRWKAVKEGFR
jgi:hypothetical protein